MTHVYFKYAIAAVIVFDLTRPSTYEAVRKVRVPIWFVLCIVYMVCAAVARGPQQQSRPLERTTDSGAALCKQSVYTVMRFFAASFRLAMLMGANHSFALRFSPRLHGLLVSWLGTDSGCVFSFGVRSVIFPKHRLIARSWTHS